MNETELIRRRACRAILLTPEREVLLIKIGNQNSDWVGWITPGGGLDEGETEADGLKRELFEELGLRLETEGAKVWSRTHRFPWSGKLYEQSEVFYLVETPKFSPDPRAPMTEEEVTGFKEIRWWPLGEIESSREEFAPRNLAKLVAELIEKGPPAAPIEIGT